MPAVRQGKSSGSQLTKDFEKRKASLKKQTTNRKAQTASNSTDTSFKARSISLPEQSIGKKKHDVVVGRNNLTLEELTHQLRHPNAHVRREALLGIQQIRRAHVAALGEESFSSALPSLVRLASDDDVGVRKVYLEVLDSCLRELSHRCLKPYASFILLHINSALSHIFPDVRIDAVRALDICIRELGVEAVRGWQQIFEGDRHESPALLASGTGNSASAHDLGARTMQSYFTLLGVSPSTSESVGKAKKSSTTSTDISTSTLAIVLNSLLTFLQQAGAHDGGEDEGEDSGNNSLHGSSLWFMLPSLRHVSDRESLRSFLTVDPRFSRAGGHIADDAKLNVAQSVEVTEGVANNRIVQSFASCFRHQEVSHLSTVSGQIAQEAGHEYLTLFDCISVLLERSLVEAVANASGLGQESTHGGASVRIIRTVLSLTLLLWRGVRSATAQQTVSLRKLLDHIALRFPLGGQGDVAASAAPEKAWIDCNLAFCELSCIGTELSLKANQRKTTSNRERSSISFRLDEVSTFVGDLLHSTQARLSLRSERFQAILPSIWLLLNTSEDDGHKDRILSGLIAHWNAVPPLDGTKLLATKFIGALIRVEHLASYCGLFHPMNSTPRREMIVEWLGVSLPRLLWELQAKNIRLTDTVLSLLASLLAMRKHQEGEIQAREDGRWIDEVVSALQSSLAPFFSTQHRKHGFIEGPYLRLPADVQRPARAILHFMADDLRTPLSTAAKATGIPCV